MSWAPQTSVRQGSHVQSQPDMVVYSTWNDLSEHHYLGPYSHTNWGHSATDWYLDNTSVVPHTAYLELSAYFARWYVGNAVPPTEPPLKRMRCSDRGGGRGGL